MNTLTLTALITDKRQEYMWDRWGHSIWPFHASLSWWNTNKTIWQQHTKCAINILKYSCSVCGGDLFEASSLAKWRHCISGKEEMPLLTFFPELWLRQTSRFCRTLRVHMAAVCCPVTWQLSWQQINNLLWSLLLSSELNGQEELIDWFGDYSKSRLVKCLSTAKKKMCFFTVWLWRWRYVHSDNPVNNQSFILGLLVKHAITLIFVIIF